MTQSNSQNTNRADQILAQDNLAIITGGASGIGLATATELAQLGMRIVLLDIEKEKLPAAKDKLIAASGINDPAKIITMELDVSDADAFATTAKTIIDQYGAPSFLMNNAAVRVHGGTGAISDSLDIWHLIFNVNFFGILNGIANFLPAMLDAKKPAMIVNTGSKQGLTNPPGNPAYNTGKAALNAYTQNLAHDLRNRESQDISAHLLVPGWTTTGDAEHRQGAWTAQEVAQYLIEHLRNDDFYIICPDDETTSEMDKKRLLWQAQDMIENRPALSRWHPDFAEAFAQHMKKPLGD